MEWRDIKGPVMEKVSMKRYTSMKVGGPVKYMISPVDEEDLRAVLARLREENVAVRFLGKGTNVIVSDSGLNEAVVRVNRMQWIHRTKLREGGTLIDAAGGVPLRGFIKALARRGLSGMEKLYWIPGTVGGAVKMNAGSFGVSISDTLRRVRLLDTRGEERCIREDALTFSYRSSPVKASECVLSAEFSLKERAVADIGADMEYVYQERKKRHPMEFPSAGSVFKSVNGVAAWRFIEKAGLKGRRIGDAAVSEKHANFIINLGAAKALDIKRLIETIKAEVLEHEGVALEEEVELWGFCA
jgi:UDP-N-acetylmuramate dehydrogenase